MRESVLHLWLGAVNSRDRNRNAWRTQNGERLACPRIEAPTAGSLGVARQAFLEWERKCARLGHNLGAPRPANSARPRPVLDLRRIHNLTDVDPEKAPCPTPSQPL